MAGGRFMVVKPSYLRLAILRLEKTQATTRLLQALVEVISKRQSLQRTWELNLIQCIVEAIAKVQIIKATWQLHSLQNLNWALKSELLDAERKVHILQALLKIQA